MVIRVRGSEQPPLLGPGQERRPIARQPGSRGLECVHQGSGGILGDLPRAYRLGHEPERPVNLDASSLCGPAASSFIDDGNCTVDFRPGQGCRFAHVALARAQYRRIRRKDTQHAQAVDADFLQPSQISSSHLGMARCVSELVGDRRGHQAFVAGGDAAQGVQAPRTREMAEW